MGRGRAKAKQTKVARELKYSTPNTDFSALERELHGPRVPDSSRGPSRDSDDYADDDDDRWVSGDR
ncbi:DUF3073 domain-containing protein [Agilicoccus flavus]|uniref:DUF3073 domain-containing protein n=1 Tax=Agilicoccus flavus TaxID=2775968 RepID=UPI001CF61D4C|nr:DUF3073 domain-containing protein [Agilicoccus flavus]